MMELELGLKITRTRDDASSSSSSSTTTTTDFRVSKDPFGPISISRETNNVFVLVIHLRGYKKENVGIEINREGNRMKISGSKAVEEMVMVKWVRWKKEVEIKAFRKVFLIPEIVDLDRIKARFNEEDGTLKITLPKRVKGITGLTIDEEEPQEVKETEEENRGGGEEEEEEERDEIVEEEKIEGEAVEEREKDEGNGKQRRKKRKKRCCFPFLAGSSLLMSIIFFIIHLIQSKSKRK